VPDACRPDRSKVVLLADSASRRLVAHCDASVAAPWRREPIYALLKRMAHARWGTGEHVVAVAADRQWLITPTDDLDLGRIEPGTPYRIRELPTGDVMCSLRVPASSGGGVRTIERHIARRHA
jgi:hypothetical protein